MEFDESKYYALGNKFLDGGALIAFAVLAFFCGYRMWPQSALYRTVDGGR